MLVSTLPSGVSKSGHPPEKQSMNHPLFEKHQSTLERAVAALSARTYWSPYSESPSPKAYGETAAQEGKSAFESYIGKVFPLDQPGRTGTHGGERSPYGADLNITYPICDPEQLIQASLNAAPAWEKLGHSGRASLLIEVLERLNRRSFEIGHAVGQRFDLAFGFLAAGIGLVRDAAGLGQLRAQSLGAIDSALEVSLEGFELDPQLLDGGVGRGGVRGGGEDLRVSFRRERKQGHEEQGGEAGQRQGARTCRGPPRDGAGFPSIHGRRRVFGRDFHG